MKKKILVTGASRGIGLAVSNYLLRKNYSVIGIARNFSKSSLEHEDFVPIELDLSDLKSLPKRFKELSQEHPDVCAILCNAGRGCFGNLEEISYGEISSIMELNFLSHAFLVKSYLPHFKKRRGGNIIFIGSEAAIAGKRKGSIYCATKFALRGFAQALRDECSSANISVSVINPGMTQTDFFQNLSFSPGKESFEHILPEDIAKVVFMLLEARPGTVFEEINLSPQKKKIEISSFGARN